MARPATGSVVERRRARGTVYALRFRAYGERQYVTLGDTSEGWTAARAEMELQNEEPHTRLENITAGRYLVQFNSVLFTNMSEWQMRRRCVLAKESGLIKCDSVEQ